MVLDQKWLFFQTFFFRQYRHGKCLSLYSRTKKAFLGYKKKKLKKSKNWHFSKVVNPWFRSKINHFSKLFFLMIRRPPRSTLSSSSAASDVYKRQAFSRLQKQEVQKVEILTFFQRVNPCFWSKNGQFSPFFFRHFKPGKCILWYSRTKKRFSRL